MDNGKKTSTQSSRSFEPPPIIKAPKKPNQEYKRRKLLGEGGFGKCYEIEDKEGKILAVKVVAKSSLRSSKNRDKLLSEIQIHKIMDHPHIVKFYECFEDSSFVYMIMELCENKTLAYMNKRRQRLTEAEVRYFMRQLLDACEYMHRCFVIHRDLKLANLFLSKDMKIKIGDFGLAARLERKGERKKTICGTPNYIAPEILFDQVKGHSFEADVWSLGVIMYTLLFGRPPFQTEGKVDQIYKKIKELKYDFPGNINDVSKEAKALINLMLTLEPEKRPTIQQIRDNDFFLLGVIPTEIPVSALTIAPSFELPPLTKPRINLSLANRRPLRVIQIGSNLNNLNSASTAKKSIHPVEVKTLATKPENKLINPVTSNTETISTQAPLTSVSTTNSTRVQNITNAVVLNHNNTASTSSSCVAKKDPSNKARIGVLESVYNTLSTAFDKISEGKESLPQVFDDKSPTTPLVFISKWMDYTNKYGLGYQLTDGSVGVNFNDKTTLIMSPNGCNFEYIYNNKTSANCIMPIRKPYTVDDYPQDLNKKLYLLQNFRNYMNEVLPKISPTYTFVDKNRTHNMEFLTKYKRTPHAVLFRLSNRLLQVNFFDHEKIILSEEGRVITYIDEARGINTHTISEILRGDYATEKNRLKYVKDVLKKLIEAVNSRK
ncbi:Pkinase-domain-containing protein [Gigaspora margarita]|uniref:Serine/threonine-protein kinase n=1 Tax=Gigaspora margarita TaxID=4874 RepID=A0A8H4APQ8_GIGMA|nr:Pkinase-domain-containing protein [Gigaspora margarita]